MSHFTIQHFNLDLEIEMPTEDNTQALHSSVLADGPVIKPSRGERYDLKLLSLYFSIKTVTILYHGTTFFQVLGGVACPFPSCKLKIYIL